jgi:hemolysin activation/secretion protein
MGMNLGRGHPRTRVSALVLSMAFLAAAPSTLAQQASQITPDEFQPPQQRLTGSLVFSGEPGLAAPPGSDQLNILISDVSVEGTLPGMESETRLIEARLTRGRIAVSEIFDAVTALEEAYVRAGFVLARVVLPAQNLSDGGSLRISVVDGFVENIDASNVPERLRARLSQLTRPLIGQRGVRSSQLERRILLAGDTYGVALGSALATGATPGGTVIILEPNFRRITGFVGFDNAQSDALGRWNLDGGVEFNGQFGLGEVLYLRGTVFPGDGVFGPTPRLRTLAAGGVLPLNADGLNFNLELSDSRSSPDDGTPSKSIFQKVSARLYYPPVRSRNLNVTTQLALDLQEDRLYILAEDGDLPWHLDRTTVLRASADAVWLREGGSSFDASAIFSLGLDALGARTAADAEDGTPLSRAGADATFQKLEVSAGYRRAVGPFNVAFTARGQTSFGDPLVVGEQVGIAELNELSAFASGTLNGDSGWVLRGEVGRPFEIQARGIPVTLRPYAFAGAGSVHRENAQEGEVATINASAFGLGLEALISRDDFSSASARIEVARGERDDGEEDGTRISVFGSLRF